MNFDLEDTVGAIRCIMWPTEYAQFGSLVQADAILVARGTLDRRGGDEANLVVNELIPLEDLQTRYTRGIVVRIHEHQHNTETLRQLREILRGYPGNLHLHLVMYLSSGTRVRLAAPGTRLEINPEMKRRVDELLGPGNFRLVTGKGRGDRRREMAV